MKERKLPKYNHAPGESLVKVVVAAAARRTTMVQNARSLEIIHQSEYVEAVFYSLSTGSEEIWVPVLRDVALRLRFAADPLAPPE